jgi:nucleotide-binding universal stress UspA family protein
MYKHILIPTDGSETAEKAVSAGIEFARETGARVTLFTAVPEYVPPREGELLSGRAISIADHERNSERKAAAILAPLAERARAAGVETVTDHAQSNHAWQAIIDAAGRHGCDAIFMGSHGRKGLSRLMHGSQTVDVLSHSSIPTLVFR